MKILKKHLKLINEHTLNAFPNEAVFVITLDDELHILDNIANDPENYFEVELGDLHNQLKYLIHSHTFRDGDNALKFEGHMVDPRMPSKMDMQLQLLLDIEFGILSCNGREVSDILWYPDLNHPILNNEYISGIHDCYSIIRRWYYQNKNIILDEHPRDFLWWNDNPDIYLNCFKYGWEEINVNDMDIGDMLIFRIGRYESHGGLYIGDGKFIHHMNRQLSRTENLSGWMKRLSRVVRYKG